MAGIEQIGVDGGGCCKDQESSSRRMVSRLFDGRYGLDAEAVADRLR
jgi:hypothetical protein